MDDFVDPTLLDLDRYAIGQPVPRSEDPVLVSGKGRFTDDINLPGQAYCAIVRSHYAHGIIRGIDTAAARGMPGVLGVYTAAELEAAGVGPLPPRQVMNNRDGTPMLSPVAACAGDRQGPLCRRPDSRNRRRDRRPGQRTPRKRWSSISTRCLPSRRPGRRPRLERRFSTTMCPPMSGSIFTMATARRLPPLLPPPRM